MAIQPESVEQLFEAALALKPIEREAFLVRTCGDDPELKRTVEGLLAEDAQAGSLLEQPPLGLLRRLVQIASHATNIRPAHVVNQDENDVGLAIFGAKFHRTAREH